jgi:aspartyl-tRNA(Asn)/glutamyl-tRNA(Gln) amidotransferase subunit A
LALFDKIPLQFDPPLTMSNTVIGNVLNLCGLSVPCGFTSQDLPIGVMIHGKLWNEDVALRMGYAFQQATDWHVRRPDLSWVA